MTVIASRDLRNHTADVLRQVAQGARVTVTVNGIAAAEIGPVSPTRRLSMRRQELLGLLSGLQADAGLRDELRDLTGDTTDDLGPIA